MNPITVLLKALAFLSALLARAADKEDASATRDFDAARVLVERCAEKRKRAAFARRAAAGLTDLTSL